MKDKITFRLKSETLDKDITHSVNVDLMREGEHEYVMELFSMFLLGCGIVINKEEEPPESNEEFWKDRVGDN
jgi:hypothetical protein